MFGDIFGKVMVCSDGSDGALRAAHIASELARKFGSQVVLLTVFDPSVVHAAFTGIPGGPLATATDAGRYADGVQEAVEQEAGMVFADAGVPYTPRRELGHPVDRIVSAAQDEKTDVIVMGSRGLGGFEKMRLGSVSDGVLRHAPCPVLIVR